MSFLFLACVLPVPDLRRPDSFVVMDGSAPAGTVVRVCSFADAGPPTAGCDDVAEANAEGGKLHMPAWTYWPTQLASEPPYWAEVYTACAGEKPVGITFRGPDWPAKGGDEVHIALDQPPTHVGGAFRDVADADLAVVATKLCGGSAKKAPTPER